MSFYFLGYYLVQILWGKVDIQTALAVPALFWYKVWENVWVQCYVITGGYNNAENAISE